MCEETTFEEALAATEGAERTLLLGAGAALQFMYGSLLSAAIEDGRGDAPLLASKLVGLFRALNTQDFEEVIWVLEMARSRAVADHDHEKADRYAEAAGDVRTALLRTIEARHPRFRADGDYSSAIALIQNFKSIFTLNYDLLLNWTLIGASGRWKDGFGIAEPDEDGLRSYTRARSTNVFHLHGGLHLFPNGDPQSGASKITSGGSGVISAIGQAIAQKKVPLYVAEGACQEKRDKIRKSPYLTHGLERLRQVQGPVFTLGHSAGMQDEHVYEAIFSASEVPLYAGVFDNADRGRVKIKLEQMKARCGGKRPVILYCTRGRTPWPA